MTEKDRTVGSYVKEILSNPNLDRGQSLKDTSLEMQKKMLPEIEKCINNHKHWDDPFYVVIINRRERLMVNVIRQHYVARKTLPTPDYDQSVFKYFPKTGDLKYLWTVPDKMSVDYLVINEANVPERQKELAEMCRLFKQEQLDIVKGE